MGRRKPPKISIRICGPPQAISRSSEFWSKWEASEYDASEWYGLVHSRHFKRRLREFCKVHSAALSTHFNQFDRLHVKKLLLKEHDRVEEILRGFHIDVERLSSLKHMPGVFFWMRDKEEAVFVLSHTGPGTQGLAFYTTDTNILNLLDKAWENVECENIRREEKLMAFKGSGNFHELLTFLPEASREIVADFLKIPIE